MEEERELYTPEKLIANGAIDNLARHEFSSRGILEFPSRHEVLGDKFRSFSRPSIDHLSVLVWCRADEQT
jgi:hypothetical protein